MTAFQIAGYLGLLLSVIFGLNQLRVIWQRHSSEGVSLLDYAMRVLYSVLLGIYSVSKHDLIFVASNIAAGLISLGVLGIGYRTRRR